MAGPGATIPADFAWPFGCHGFGAAQYGAVGMGTDADLTACTGPAKLGELPRITSREIGCYLVRTRSLRTQQRVNN